MQPPPRKGNYAKFLKNLHSEQINKLVLKNQHECDLLEDIRTFTIKRSAIEKSYSEALLKISSAYLNKKIPNIPDIKLEGGEEKWNMWNVWRTVLEENEKLARARLAACEVFQQQIADDAKILRAHKLAMSKKVTDQLTMVQKELQTCVTDLDKTKKLYFDEEHTAHDVRDKARDIEEKLKKKKGSFFQSITSLQKNSAKVTSKREQLEEKSTGARNDYLLCLAAANAHQTRYFVIDLQLGMTSMESGVYDKVAEYLSLMSGQSMANVILKDGFIGRTELLTCSAMQNSFTTIREQARQLTREYNLQCCYLYYPVLKQHIQYDFEPCDNDPTDHVTADHESSSVTLSKEARRWATKIARENNNIKESVRKLQLYNALRESGQKTDPNDPNGPDLETKIEEQKQNIRRAETAKAKAEARVECLRKGGVNVDEWLKEAESLNVQDIQRSASSLSDHPSSDSFYDSDFAEGEPTSMPTEVKAEKVEYKPDFKADFKEGFKEDEEEEEAQDQDFIESGEMDAVLEQERQRIEQLTAGWDDPTRVDWGAEAVTHGTDGYVPEDAVPPGGPLLKCTALYSYTAQNPDELTIVENEQLEVVGEGDGDGWLRARNYRGEEGYVPHNYLDIEKEPSATTPGLQAQISFSSVDYTVDSSEEPPQTETTQSPEQISVISLPTAQKAQEPPVTYCIALYDYEGEGTEELSFDEGQIIKVLSKIAHSVDDGWWQGEFDGKIGNFPSLVVEECDEYGEPLSNPVDETPPPSAPPVFTPPDIPEALREEMENGFDSPPFVEPPSLPPPGPPPAAISSATPNHQTPPAQSHQAPPAHNHHSPPTQNHQAPPTQDPQAPPAPPGQNPPAPPGQNPPAPPGQNPPAPPGQNHQARQAQNHQAPPAQSHQKKKSVAKKKQSGDFSMVLSRNHHEQYGTQFDEDDDAQEPPTSAVVPPTPPSIPAIGVPTLEFSNEDGTEMEDHSDPDRKSKATKEDEDDSGLGVAQIVITAATPMCEEPDRPFPSAEDEATVNHEEVSTDQEVEIQELDSDVTLESQSCHGNGCSPIIEYREDLPDVIPEEDEAAETLEAEEIKDRNEVEDQRVLVSSSTGSDGETTGPSTAENSVSHAPPPLRNDSDPPKQVVGGRASIPDELEPHQLARLQDLKESNA